VVRVIGIRGRGDTCAVGEDVAAGLPGREEEGVFELPAGVCGDGRVALRGGVVAGAGRGGGEGVGGRGRQERVQLLVDGVVEGVAGEAEEVCAGFKRLGGWL